MDIGSAIIFGMGFAIGVGIVYGCILLVAIPLGLKIMK